MARYDDARRELAGKYKQCEAVAKEDDAHVEGLILGMRAAMAEVDAQAPKELLAVASNARRKVVEAFRDRLLPKDIRARLQSLFEPLDRGHREILDTRHKAYLERKERRERLVRERKEWDERRERERRERDEARERERRERDEARRREQLTAEARCCTTAPCTLLRLRLRALEAPKGERRRSVWPAVRSTSCCATESAGRPA